MAKWVWLALSSAGRPLGAFSGPGLANEHLKELGGASVLALPVHGSTDDGVAHEAQELDSRGCPRDVESCADCYMDCDDEGDDADCEAQDDLLDGIGQMYADEAGRMHP
jgi:hypothetical protein